MCSFLGWFFCLIRNVEHVGINKCEEEKGILFDLFLLFLLSDLYVLLFVKFLIHRPVLICLLQNLVELRKHEFNF